MSPVSRGRKPKKRKKNSPAKGRGGLDRAAVAALEETARLMEGPDHEPPPPWFAPAIDAALDHTEAVLAARGPRQLEQAATELIGAQLHARLYGDDPDGLWFDWWAEELATAAADRVLEAAEQPASGGWKAPWRLLHALLSIGTPQLTTQALIEIDRCAPALGPLGDLPSWLSLMPQVKATGKLWRLRDAYGTRRAIIAGYSYPDGLDHSVFLFDHDLSRHEAELVAPGMFSDVDEASAAWRAHVGASADRAVAIPVEDPADAQALALIDLNDQMVMGDEPREVLDNWFRARRRIDDLAITLEKRGTPLPEPQDLWGVPDVDAIVNEFTTWHEHEHGTAPDPTAVRDLAENWVEGTVPETWYLASPRRLEIQRRLIDDWLPDDPVTLAVKALLPKWVTWLTERAELPRDLADQVLAAARPDPNEPN